jgi:YVTN family beta-propeller protein
VDNERAVEIRLLGPLEVVAANGRGLELGGGRQRALLVVLALRPNEVVSNDTLIDALWGEAPPPTALKALQGLVSQLRRALAPLGEEVIGTRSPGYVLAVDPDVVDAHRFERLAAMGRRELESDTQRAAGTLREALGLWRGDALAEFAYEPFAQDAVRQFADERLEASESLFEAELALGRHAEVTTELQALVAANPLRERLRGQLMLALYRSGRQADALEAYREGRLILDRELGLEPDVELRRLEQAILAQDPALGRVEKPRTHRPPTVRRRRLAVAAAAVTAACAVAAGAFALAGRGDGVPTVVPDSLVEIDVETGEIEDVIPVGRDPGQVEIVGPYVFVTSQEDKTLYRLDTRSGHVDESGVHATDGALVADGEFLWATSASRAEVVRIHSESMRATERVPLANDLLQAFVAVGAGSLWISQFPPAAVLRVHLSDHRLERRYDLPFYESPVEITFGDGASWTAVGAELLRIDAQTGKRESISAGQYAGDPELRFGSVWAGSAGGSAVWRIDPVTGRTTATVSAGTVTFGLATGAGSVWVTNYCDGTVSRIDPATNAVVSTIEIGYQPKWLAVGHGRVWVGVSGTRYPELGCDGPVRG